MTRSSSFLVLLLLASCATVAETRPAVRERAAGVLPASALAGAVRALETLDAVRPAGALTQVRALESDTLVDPATGVERVRVFLHLTVYAETTERAWAALDELRAALEAEAAAAGRTEPAPAGRVQRALAELDWTPAGNEGWVSVSEAVRLTITPGTGTPAPASARAASGMALGPYVRERAAREIGPVALSMGSRSDRSGATELSCRIEDDDVRARHSRAEIAGFLSALEHESPAARLVRLEIERSQHEPDVHAERGWTFAAELAVLAEPGASSAGS